MKLRIKRSDEILIVVFGRNERSYATRCSLKSAKARQFTKNCALRESLKAGLEGYRVLPIFDFEQHGAVYMYRLNYEAVNPVEVDLP